MKNLITLFCVLLVSFFSSIATAEVTALATLAETESSIYLHDGTKIKSHLIDQNIPELKATIKVSYPQILGDKLSVNEQQFNQLVLGMANDEIEQFKKYVKADLPHMKTLPKEVQNNYLDIDYDIDVIHPNKSSIIMVRLKIEGMQAGRAHPYHNYRVFNFSLDKGKVIGLADLFKPKTNYLKLIADYSRQQLLAKATDSSVTQMIKQGTILDPNNFRNWNIQNDTLLITFDEYQVAPYASGPQEVEIPYSVLKNILAADSEIQGCVVNPQSCGVVS